MAIIYPSVSQDQNILPLWCGRPYYRELRVTARYLPVKRKIERLKVIRSVFLLTSTFYLKF